MWSGPRNISTALMRSFGSRLDSYVTDEPFYPYFLYNTETNHPLREEVINEGETHCKKIIDFITGSIPNSKKIWYQKHMAHHILPGMDLKWMTKMKNCLLIRHPEHVIISYLKKNEIKSNMQLGYTQQVKIYEMLSKGSIYPPIIIDAGKLLLDPEKMLKKLCEILNIDFDNRMLSWPKGPQKTDGVWGKHWYKQVEDSRGFKSHVRAKEDIPSKYKAIYDKSLDCYNFLYEKRITIDR